MTAKLGTLAADAAPETVLVAAIVEWQRRHHPRVADLVDRIDAQLPVRPALARSKKRIDLATWHEVEAEGDPLDVRRLGAALGGGTQNDVIAQVRALAARKDPRIAAVLLAMLEKPPYAGVKSRDLLTLVVASLVATRDCRAAETARELAGRYLGIVNSGTGVWMVAQLQEAAVELERVEVAELSADVAAACDMFEARFAAVKQAPAPGRSLEELLAAVYAAPDDDEPRLVYADALQERGDPRGELIALQIARSRARSPITDEARAREAELLADKARLAAWAQPLSTAGECFFERGFPATIRLYRTTIAKRPDVQQPVWSTLTKVLGIDDVPQVLANEIAALPNLRSVGRFSSKLLEELCKTPRPWTHIYLSSDDAPPASVFAALPALRSLDMMLQRLTDTSILGALPVEDLELSVSSSCETLALPPTLERAKLHLRALPRLDPARPAMGLDLSRFTRLGTLRLDLSTEAASIALPASLEHFEIECPWISMPSITITEPSKLRSARIRSARLPAFSAEVARAFGVSTEPLRAFATVEELALTLREPPPARALDPLTALRSLRLGCDVGLSSPPPDPAVLAPLARLEELEVYANDKLPLRLDGLPIRKLRWITVPLDRFPAGLPLEVARVTMPLDVDELARFLARYPELAELSLDDAFPVRFDPKDEARWRRLTRVLEASSVQRVLIETDAPIRLERDDAGVLSRLTLVRGDSGDAEVLARSLTRLTSITSPTGKLPAKLARLVKP